MAHNINIKRRHKPRAWAYGIMCHADRIETSLETSYRSLANAGFDEPMFWVDGEYENRENLFGHHTVWRGDALGAYGNWLLALWELYIRFPKARRYAIFQDDLICSANLREYLERCKYPSGSNQHYLNLYTVPDNESLAPRIKSSGNGLGGFQDIQTGWYRSNQLGFGALGLVFHSSVMEALLPAFNMFDRIKDERRGTCSVDGAVVHALSRTRRGEERIYELVHYPSLTQHIGQNKSVVGNRQNPIPESFKGESFDLLKLL